MFTAGHIEFRQSLLVRAADAPRLARHRNLTDADRVGMLAAGTRVETEAGTVVADGSTA